MKTNLLNRSLGMGAAVFAVLALPFAMLQANTHSFVSVSAASSRPQKNSSGPQDERRIRQADLKGRLASSNSNEFHDALTSLTRLDEPGTLDVWGIALDNRVPQLQHEAWTRYQTVQAELERKQFVPQVVRINAPADKASQLAQTIGVEVTIWSSSGDLTFAAAPSYLTEALRSAGVEANVVYDSVTAWQKARANGDALAQAITPEYQSGGAEAGTVMRIAVVDLATRSPAATGYSDWLGDPEDLLMRDGSRVAYLDMFSSDGSIESINTHIAQRYTRRGYKLAGFYTPQEFAEVAPRIFPGKSFDAGRRAKSASASEVHITLANGKYHSYDQTVSEFKALAASHPDLARYSKLGSSFEGREIFALKISKDASVDDASKPDVLITGCHHAREWISVESPVYIANQLLSGYATDDSIKYLVDHLQIWVVPIMNPDGLTYTQNSPNDGMDPVRLWRKNRRPISVSSCASGVGVDLNRNYRYEWRLQNDSPCADYCSSDRSCLNDDIGASDDPTSEIYRGPQPESEPEVKAIKSLVDDPNRHFRAQLDYHNYSQLILYPWGFTPFRTDDSRTLSQLAARMSDDLFSVDRVRYFPEQAIDLYALTGSSIDYAYGVNHVPAPFVVEMRPQCCAFTVPESQIPVVNQENWTAARSLLNWAAGPPILEAVKAYSLGTDGTFSKLIYSARWSPLADDPGNKRQMIVDTHFPGIAPGPLQVKLQFSKPMNTSLPPVATLGRDAQLDEVTMAVIKTDEGWQKTVYASDTWVGETVVLADDNLTSPWQLAVSSTDPVGLMLDAGPGTIANYTAGGGNWQGYEDSTGQGSDGGVDTQHTIGPGVRGDYPNIFVASPNGGERLPAGDDYAIVWIAPNAPGFPQTLTLSTDSGLSFSVLAANIPSDVQRYHVKIPQVSTTRARIRLLAFDTGVTHNLLVATSQADFSICSNVGSNVDLSFVASEKMDLNWTDTSSDDPPSTTSGASRLLIDVKITNRGSIPILNPFLRVGELTRNVLLTRDPQTKSAEGARQTIDSGSDNTLSPGETVTARLAIGVVKPKGFSLSLNLYGVPSGGTIAPADSVNIWTGKPRTR
jgi:carboxypeptidase T